MGGWPRPINPISLKGWGQYHDDNDDNEHNIDNDHGNNDNKVDNKETKQKEQEKKNKKKIMENLHFFNPTNIESSMCGRLSGLGEGDGRRTAEGR